MEKNFTEAVLNNIQHSKINEEQNLIKKVCVLTHKSRNHRRYSDKALESVAGFINREHIRCFVDHAMNDTPSVKNLLGVFSNGIVENKAVYADLEILQSNPMRNLIFEIATKAPHLAGLSIAGRGVFGDTDKDGYEKVDDVVALMSCDFVSTPASTNSVFESQGIAEIRLENERLKSELKEIRRLLSFLKLENDRLSREKSNKPSVSKEQFFNELNQLCE